MDKKLIDIRQAEELIEGVSPNWENKTYDYASPLSNTKRPDAEISENIEPIHSEENQSFGEIANRPIYQVADNTLVVDTKVNSVYGLINQNGFIEGFSPISQSTTEFLFERGVYLIDGKYINFKTNVYKGKIIYVSDEIIITLPLSLTPGSLYYLYLDDTGDYIIDTIYSIGSGTGAITLASFNTDSNGLYEIGSFVDLREFVTLGEAETYTNANPVPETIGGISAGSTFNNKTTSEMLDLLLYPYIAPSISLSANVSPGIFEFGNNINSLTLNATTIKKSNPITLVEFYRGASLIHSVPSPNANGGLESYVETNPITSSVSFSSKVGDGTQIITSNSISYTYVYPYYVGDTSMSTPDETTIKAMTKLIKTKSNTTRNYTITNSRFCIAFPSSYGNLTSVLDANLFNITGDFTIQTLNMTMLDSQVVSYKVYIFNNITTQTNFNVYFNI
jgi:hypothetical protein